MATRRPDIENDLREVKSIIAAVQQEIAAAEAELKQATGDAKQDARDALARLGRREEGLMKREEGLRAELVELQKQRSILLADSTPSLFVPEEVRDLLSPCLLNSAPDSPAWNLFRDCKIESSPADTAWLRDLAVADVRTRIVFDDDEANDERARLSMLVVSDHLPSHHPFTAAMTSTILFIRAVYFQLFEELFSLDLPTEGLSPQRAVIGNPGTGKSWFHIFIIWRLLRIHRMEEREKPSLFLPTCIVQQLGFNLVCIYDLVSLTVWTATLSDERLLLVFSHEKAIYLFDPARDPDSKPRYVNLRAIVTTSPKRIRIKEFLKDASVSFYMPVWREEELLMAGAWLQDTLPTGHKMKLLLSSIEIEKRIEQFGGIIRHVLPLNAKHIEKAKLDQTAAIAKVSFQQMFAAGTAFDDREENHSYHIFHYHVPSDLMSIELMFPCRYVEIQLRARVTEVKFEEALEQLTQAMNGNLPERMRLLLETVTYGLLARNVNTWAVIDHIPYVRRDEVFGVASLDYPGTRSTLGDIMERLNCPRFRQRLPRVARQRYIHTHDFPGVGAMEDDTLYIFGQTNFPFVEAIYKRKGVIYGIQCKSGFEFVMFSPATCLRFRKLIGAESHTPIVIWLVCTPRNVPVWLTALHKQTHWAEPTDKTKEDYELWADQVLACESTVFSIAAHSLEHKDVASGDLDERTVSAEGNNLAEITVGTKRRRMEGNEPQDL